MAQMCPPFFDLDVNSAAERRLYEAFARELDDQWVVFHHVKWVGTDDRGHQCDGETDFVIAHPRLGVLVIEVKGGRINFDAGTGHFISTDRDGCNHDIGDPFEQAMKGKKNLLKKVRRMREWPRGRVLFGHMVAFPDAVTQSYWVRPNAPKDIIIDSMALVSLDQKLRDAYRFWDATHSDLPLGNAGIRVLISALYQSGTIRNPLLAESIRNDEHTLVHLTEKQLGYLRFLQSHRSAAIAGCAGSGKTFLAVEKARQLAENEQMKVLFTCYNQGLAYHIAEELGYKNFFDVADFHQLCINWAKQANKSGPNDNAPDYFNSVLPNLLLEAIDTLGPKYDAIVVDEGQDFLPQWWEVLPWLLHNPNSGHFYIFFDDNQRIYRDRGPIPITQAPYHLDENCRNTRSIADIVNQFYTGMSEYKPKVLGPQGQPVEVTVLTDHQAEKDQLRRLLHRLFVDNGFSYDQVALLSARGTLTSNILGQHLGNVQLTDQLPLSSGEVFATTIRRFKGLERTVIVLCEIGEHISQEDIDTLMYIGTSRAKAYLIIVLGPQTPQSVLVALKPYIRQ